VFAALDRMPADSHVKISFLEIYNEVRACAVGGGALVHALHTSQTRSSAGVGMAHQAQEHHPSPPPLLPYPHPQRLDDLLAAEPSAFMSEAAARPIAKSGKERNLFGDGVSTPVFAGSGAAGGVGALGGGGVAALAGGERLKIVEDKRTGMRVQNLEVRGPLDRWDGMG